MPRPRAATCSDISPEPKKRAHLQDEALIENSSRKTLYTASGTKWVTFSRRGPSNIHPFHWRESRETRPRLPWHRRFIAKQSITSCAASISLHHTNVLQLCLSRTRPTGKKLAINQPPLYMQAHSHARFTFPTNGAQTD